MLDPAPGAAGTVTGVHVEPPSLLAQVRHAPSASWPEITVLPPAAAAQEMLAAPASVLRCQVKPSGEVQITACAVPPAALACPAARNPVAVAVSTQTWSPGCCGAMPWVPTCVQDRPSVLVQMPCVPAVEMATQPCGPPATRVAT